MQSNNTDQYIQKKLLYKCQKQLTTVCQQYFKIISGKPSNMKIDDLLQQIDNLQFQNFKYKIALLSTQKQRQRNENVLKQVEANIQETSNQLKELTQNLRKARIAKTNKSHYNQMAKSIKKYDKRKQSLQKMETLDKQINQIRKNYQTQQKIYHQKQRCLTIALSALKGFLGREKQPQNTQPN